MTGILLPMERYNASMFYTVPSSPAVVNVTLQHWNASMLQNTYIPPAVVCVVVVWCEWCGVGVRTGVWTQHV